MEDENTPKVLLLKAGRILVWFVYFVIVLVLVLLTIAFFLQLFGANPYAGFSQWIYRNTARAMQPFRGLFPPIEVSDQSTLDTSLLFAMVIYGLVALAIHALIDWLTRTLHRDEAKAIAKSRAEQAQAAPSSAYTYPGGEQPTPTIGTTAPPTGIAPPGPQPGPPRAPGAPPRP